MAKYTYVLADLMSGTLKEEVPLRSVTWGHDRNRAGVLSASIDRRHPKATRGNFDPSRTALYLLRQVPGSVPVCVWGGILWTVRSNGDGLNIGANTFWSYFNRRYLRKTFDYTAVPKDPAAIAREFLDYAQSASLNPGGDIGVLNTGTTLTGGTVARIWNGFEMKNLGAAIEALTDNALSFDFDITVSYDSSTNTFTKNFEIWAPQRGRHTGIVWEIGQHCELGEYGLDGTKQANACNGIGAGDGNDMLLVTASDPNQLASSTNTTGYPLLEDTTIYKDISQSTHLRQVLEARLAQRSFPMAMPNVFLRDVPDSGVGSFVTGDYVTLRGGDGFTTFDREFRIDNYEVTVTDEGQERTKVEFVKSGVEEEAPGLEE
jgi:hypothetical protein